MDTSARLERRWNSATLLVFAALIGFGLWRHEPWRDELQAWMIARASHTPLELLRNLRHEGHPFLWYAVLWPLAKLHRAIWVFQLTQWFIAVLTAALVLWRAPFSRLTRILVVFGYFSLYEYGVLARSYGLGILLIVIGLVNLTPQRRWLRCGFALALLSLTSAFGAIIALSITIAIFVQDRAALRGEARKLATTAAAFVVAGCGIAFAQAKPSGSTGSFAGWHTSVDAHLGAAVISAVFRALIPIPKLQHSWWNTSIGDGHTGIAAVAAIVLLGAVGWSLRSHAGARTLWLLGCTATIAFLYLKIGQADAARYYGHLWFIFIAAVWFAASDQVLTTPAAATPRIQTPPPTRFLLSRFLVSLCALHVAIAVGAIVADATQPFTDAASTATWIRNHVPGDASIVACPDFAGETIAAYLDHPIYFADGARFGTFVVWDKHRLDVSVSADRAFEIADHGRSTTRLLITNHNIATLAPHLVFTRSDGIVVDEHYWVYRFTGLTQPAPPDPCRRQ